MVTLHSVGLKKIIEAHMPDDFVVSSAKLVWEYSESKAKENQRVRLKYLKLNPLIFTVKRDGYPGEALVCNLTVKWIWKSFTLTGIAIYESTLTAIGGPYNVYDILSRMGSLVERFAGKTKKVRIPTKIVKFPVPEFIEDLEIYCTPEELDEYKNLLCT